MSRDMRYVTYMPTGKSNRVVVDLDMAAKRELYSALAKDGLTLKAWFNQNMVRYLRERRQLTLFKREEETVEAKK